MLFNSIVFRECQESWKAVVIDEFQDTSAMQYCLLRILASHNRITIVGDEDQVLYIWQPLPGGPYTFSFFFIFFISLFID